MHKLKKINELSELIELSMKFEVLVDTVHNKVTEFYKRTEGDKTKLKINDKKKMYNRNLLS